MKRHAFFLSLLLDMFFCRTRSDFSLVNLSEKNFHIRTVLWRAELQALVFHQNANNIICNIQGNIIVVVIGEKKLLMAAPAHPTSQLS